MATTRLHYLGSFGASQEVAQCLEVGLGFLQVGQMAVLEHDQFGTRHQAVVPGGVLGPGDPWRPHTNRDGTESSPRRSVRSWSL
jgi:hypothetical protein